MFISKKLGRLFAVVCALILSSGLLLAQDLTITGKVVDGSNEPIVGAYVVVEGTTVGTSTDADGAYRINASANGTLTFTCIGYNYIVMNRDEGLSCKVEGWDFIPHFSILQDFAFLTPKTHYYFIPLQRIA